MFYKIVRGLIRFLLSLIYRIEIEGMEHIPKEGRGIIALNHFSLMDPVLIGVTMPRKINYMAKANLFSNKLFALVLNKLGAFPVKRGGADIGAIKVALRTLNRGEIFGIFPEGTRSRKGEVLEAKPGLAMIAIRTQSPIIPAAIVGSYRPFSKVRIIIGEPVELSDYYGEKISTEKYQELSQNVLDIIRKLMI